MKSITVKKWVTETGIVESAKICGVDASTVRNWRRGFVLPDSRQMKKIRQLTKGVVSIDASIDEHFSPKNKSRYIGRK